MSDVKTRRSELMKYCAGCGRPMMVVEAERRYDTDTGELEGISYINKCSIYEVKLANLLPSLLDTDSHSGEWFYEKAELGQ